MKIGLSLSGGGARGAAHVGLIRALEEAGVPPVALVGVSAGSIVGGLYAAGKSVDEIVSFMKRASIYRLLSFGIPRKGLTSLSYLRKKLIAELGEDLLIEDLPKPFTIGVTNLISGQLELRSSGPLVDLICASSAIPFIFRPVEIDGALYADGGIICNMPVEPLFRDEQVDFVIGSNLISAANISPGDLSSIWGIMWRTFDLTIIAGTNNSLDQCQAVFEPPGLEKYNIFDFSRIKLIYEESYQFAQQWVSDLKAAHCPDEGSEPKPARSVSS